MISSKGQAIIETLVTITAMLLVIIPGILLLLSGLGTLILTKWASKNCHCLAKSIDSKTCKDEVQHSLSKNFAFKQVEVKVKTVRGIIHSEVSARLIGHTLLKGTYDLEPSEYRRTP